MTEQNTEPQRQSVEPTDTGRDKSSSLLIGGSILAVIVALGVAFSLVIFFRGGDEPLVPADGGTGTASPADPESAEFEQDPFFDEQGRVVYVPLDSQGAALDQTTPSGGRSDTTAPDGVMLQRIHQNMIVPFSTSDGPTDFTDNGVATGFSHTAQGAGLAAVHYVGYLSSGNNRIQMLKDAGLVEDDGGLVAKQMAINTAKKPGAVPDNFPYRVFQMIKVDYTPDLARVHIGMVLKMKDGSTQNMDAWADLVWRDGTGWIVKVRDQSTFGTEMVPAFGEGWSSWW